MIMHSCDFTGDRVAAVVLEPIQGEGGINIASKEFFQGIADLCAKENLLLIVDEVQSGMGRTGKMFALDHHEGVKADIMCLAKGIGSGLPMAISMLGA